MSVKNAIMAAKNIMIDLVGVHMFKKNLLNKLHVDEQKLEAAKASTASYFGELKSIMTKKDEEEAKQVEEPQVTVSEQPAERDKKALFTYKQGDKEIAIEKNDVLDTAELLIDVSSPRGAAKRLIKVMRD